MRLTSVRKEVAEIVSPWEGFRSGFEPSPILGPHTFPGMRFRWHGTVSCLLTEVPLQRLSGGPKFQLASIKIIVLGPNLDEDNHPEP